MIIESSIKSPKTPKSPRMFAKLKKFIELLVKKACSAMG